MLKVRVVVQLETKECNNSSKNYKNMDILKCSTESLPDDDNSSDQQKASQRQQSQSAHEEPIVLHDEANNIKAVVNLVDFTTLNMKVWDGEQPNKSVNMVFDYVSHTSEIIIQTEMSSWMDELLLKRRNCAVVLFNARREGYQHFLENMVVVNVDKRLRQLKVDVLSIEVNHWNILLDNKQDMLKKYPLPKEGTILFDNKSELKRWLQNEYLTYCSTVNGYDAVEFKFRIIDTEKRVFKLKLIILNVQQCELDAHNISKWHEYMVYLGDGVCQKPFPHIPLTSFLSTHLEANDRSNECTLLLFNIPTQCSALCTIDMLQMAHSVVENRGRLRLAKRANRTAESSSAKTEGSNASSTEGNSKNTLDNTPTTTRAGGVSFTIPVEKKSENDTRKRGRISDDSFSKRNFHQLSTWYRKIDEKFAATRHAMELCYENIYHQKSVQLCAGIKDTNDDASETECISAQGQNLLETYSNNFKTLLNTFKLLSVDIKRTAYADQLGVYLATKDFDLSQHIIRFKIEQLDRCQQRLASAVKEELRTLNSQLYRDEEVDEENIGN